MDYKSNHSEYWTRYAAKNRLQIKMRRIVVNVKHYAKRTGKLEMEKPKDLKPDDMKRYEIIHAQKETNIRRNNEAFRAYKED